MKIFNKQQLMEEFWGKVLFISPESIKSDDIGVVSDDNVEWLIDEAVQQALESLRIVEHGDFEKERNNPESEYYEGYYKGISDLAQEQNDRIDQILKGEEEL